MRFLDYIVEYLADASDWFYDAYQEVRGWIFPFHYLSTPLYRLYGVFYWLSYYFGDFNDWVRQAADWLGEILNYWDILGLFRSYFDAAMDAWDWVRYAVWNVGNIVADWWSDTKSTVLAWVDEAKSYAKSLVDDAVRLINNLQSAWDDFKGRIPTIDDIILWWKNWTGNVLTIVNTWWSSTLTEVQSLIDSAFVTREQFWDGWQDWRDKITEFFTDPEDWLYKSLDRIVERFW